jgi:hypothetical protein
VVTFPRRHGQLERVTGVEPSTFTLARPAEGFGKGMATSTFTTSAPSERRISAGNEPFSAIDFVILNRLIVVWRILPVQTKATILAMIQSAVTTRGR